MKDLQGVICALCTPMTEDGGAVDESALKRHIDSMLYNATVKAAVNVSGRAIGPCRPPVRSLRDEELAELRQAMGLLGAAGQVAIPA